MEQLVNNLPLAVYVAIILFIIKEIVEFIKKRISRRRKISAFKLLVAQEIERNHWAFKQIFDVVSIINELLNKLSSEFPNTEFKIINKSNGELEFLRKLDINEDGYSCSLIPIIRTEINDKLLPEIAELDKKFFKIISDAYTQIAELVHIRDGIIEYVNEYENRKYLSGFAAYAIDKKEDIFHSMERLYLLCTRKKLKEIKLR